MFPFPFKIPPILHSLFLLTIVLKTMLGKTFSRLLRKEYAKIKDIIAVSNSKLQWRSWLAHGTYTTVFMKGIELINLLIKVCYKVCRGREFKPRLEHLFENCYYFDFVKKKEYHDSFLVFFL